MGPTPVPLHLGGPHMKLRALSLAFTVLTIAATVWVLAAPWKL